MDVSVAPSRDTTRSRWLAIGACTAVVGAAVGLLSAVLRGSAIELAVAALGLLAASPFVASWLSGRSTSIVTGAGGLALGIGATVVAAALDQGGTGAFPLTMGIAVSATIALRGPGRTAWGRVVALVLIGVYAYSSGRLLSAVFVYPLLGVADEFVETFGRRSRR